MITIDDLARLAKEAFPEPDEPRTATAATTHLNKLLEVSEQRGDFIKHSMKLFSLTIPGKIIISKEEWKKIQAHVNRGN
jgi:type 1 glutamine amidotransferase